MRTFDVVSLAEPPFPARINSSAAPVGVDSLAWVDEMGLVSTADAVDRLRRAEASELAGRACPDADPEQLRLLVDLFNWLFVFDDRCDDDGLGDDPGRLSPVVARLLDILDLLGGTGPSALLAAAGPVGRSLHELCGRIRAQGRPELLVRFTGQLREYLLSLIWEATNRQCGRVPTVAEYVRMRRHTGAVPPSFTLTDLIGRIPSMATWRADPRLVRLENLATDLVCWCNDLFSYPKERQVAQGGHNLVTAVAAESRVADRSAFTTAVERYNACLTTYLQLESEVLAEGDPSVARMLTTRRCWIRGTYDWSLRAGRYRNADQCPAPQDGSEGPRGESRQARVAP